MIFSRHKYPLRAKLYENEAFYSFATQSGRDASVIDPAFVPITLLKTCHEAQLGEALLTCLQNSRAPSHRKAPELYNYRDIAASHEVWCKKIIQEFGYKTKRNMFSKMRCYDFKLEQNHNPLKSISVEKWGRRDKSYGWSDQHPVASDIALGHDPETIGKFISQLD